MIILLNGHSLQPKDRFRPEKMSLQLTERGSTASMTLGPNAPLLNVDDWVKIESGPGGGTVFRVKTIDYSYDKNTRVVSLEHLICILKDRLMFGEVTTKDISGNENEAGARETCAYILGHQHDWELWNFEYTRIANPYSFNGDDLFSALETVTDSLEDPIWEYDFSTFPFRLHIRHMDNEVTSEMRLDRNIKTLKKTIDRSRMYTRFYPIGKDDLHLTDKYISKNENLYGVVCKTETNTAKETEAELGRWAQEKLIRHCEPAVTITISGMDLAGATGEPMDSFTIGKFCRCPLPEYGTTINERITKLSYSDIVNAPMDVTVTLANELEDIASILNSQSSSSGSGGRSQATNDKEKNEWIIDTYDKVQITAKAVGGTGADGDPDWERISQLTIDGNGIDARVTYAENKIVVQEAQININEQRITQEVTDRTRSYATLTGELTVQANKINAEVTRAKSAEDSLSGRITVQANKVALVVTETAGGYVVNSASIVAGINSQTGSYVKIEADNIDLTGYVTATSLNAVDAKIDNLASGATTATSLKTNLLSASTGFTYQGHALSLNTVTISGTTYHLLGYK